MGENSTTEDLKKKLRDCETENICPGLKKIKQNFLKKLIERTKIDVSTENTYTNGKYEGIGKSTMGAAKHTKDT